MKKITKARFISSALWKLVESFSAKAISMVVTLVLARLLLPEDFGIIALTAIFTSFTDILIQGGFDTALIQKKEVDDKDYSTILILSFLIAILLYTVIFFLAPFAAYYYDENILTSVLRVLGLILFLQAFSSVRTAIVARNMQFKLMFISNFIASGISGLVAIILAYNEYGIWALVTQQLLQQFFMLLILFIKLKWKPIFIFEKDRVKTLFVFSSNVLGSSMLSYIGDSIFNVVVGKAYSLKDLGYYNKGGQFPRQFSLYTFGALTSVLLPTLVSYQDNTTSMKMVVRKVVIVSSYIIFPLMAGLIVVGKPLIVLLLTEKWLPSVQILQWACIYYAMTPLMLINTQIFFAMGKSHIRLKTEAIRLTLLVISLVITTLFFKVSINTLVAVQSLIAVIITFITFYETKKLIGYNFSELMSDIFPPLVISLAMMIILIKVNVFELNNIAILLIQVLLGIVIYLFLSFLFQLKGFKEVIFVCKEYIKRKVPK